MAFTETAWSILLAGYSSKFQQIGKPLWPVIKIIILLTQVEVLNANFSMQVIMLITVSFVFNQIGQIGLFKNNFITVTKLMNFVVVVVPF